MSMDETISPTLVDEGVDLNEPTSESIRVLVRVRPLNDDEIAKGGDNIAVTFQDDRSLTLRSTDGRKQFNCSFDAVLGPQSAQEDVYESVRLCTQAVTDGFNSTIFAYGQTGSGKTHTMFGPPSVDHFGATVLEGSPVGLIPRAVTEIFKLSSHPEVLQFSVLCSFVQLYNESCFDMLRDPSMAHPLTIREEKSEIYVQGLSEYIVKSVGETMQLLRVAEEHRAIRETNMNQFSSRSHSIFQVYVEQRRVAEDGGEIHLRAKFNLVDLAGSEKWNTKLNMGDDHISELTNINLSLHTLGKCISALVKVAKGKDSHIPYRESKLTRLLQDSLGGNSRTFLIATLSPSMLNVDESISTLKFADRAKQVMSQVSVNETRPVDHEMVLKLQREVKYLRQLLKQFVDKSAASRETLTPSAHGATDAGAGDGGSGKNGYHTNMLTSLETGDEISEAEMQSALVKATAIAKESRITTLEKENESLRRQLEASRKEATVSPKLRIKTNSPQKASQAPSDSHIKAVESLVTLAEQFDTLWKQTEIMQTTLKKFFKFEIEEDVMRQLVEQVFSQLADLQSRRAMADADSTIKLVRTGFASPKLPPHARDDKGFRSSTSADEPRSTPSKAASQQKGFLPHISAQRNDAVGGHGGPPSANAKVLIADPGSVASTGSRGGVAFRVRGQGSNTSQEEWIAPPTKEDEEAQLRKSLAKAKKKIKKNMQIQEWLQEKESRSSQMQQQEEEEQAAMAEAEREKERKRRMRAQKQKKQLSGYYQRIKEEAERLQEYKDLGIDPANLI